MSVPEFKKMFSLEGKTAIVTGGAGILGRYFCSALAEFGANVAVVDLDAKKAVELAGELDSRYGVDAIGIGCDVSSPASVKKMLETALKKFKEVHILHNNAASKGKSLKDFFEPLENFSLKVWKEIMAVNLDGMFLTAQAVGEQMKKQKKGGSVIQTASIYGIMAPDQRIYEGSEYQGRAINTPAVYSASKGGVTALTKYLASYWAPAGIRVNSLTPGGVRSGQNTVFQKKYAQRVPMGRMAEPEEMAGALVYLASDASSYVTGQNLIVDGGLHAW